MMITVHVAYDLT